MQNNDTMACPKCNKRMSPVFVEEKELDPKTEIPTGRTRQACDKLSCKSCGHEQCADSDFLAGVWQ